MEYFIHVLLLYVGCFLLISVEGILKGGSGMVVTTGDTALGDDRRYFSYYKALSVLEKVPFKITSVDQIKGLPTLGKSLLDTVKSALLCMTNKHGFLMYGKNKVGFGFLLFFECCNHAYGN